MTPLFDVSVDAPLLPTAGDLPVVFHGVNKSGSLALSHVMRAAYGAAGRAEQFVSAYHAEPADPREFAGLVERASGHGFFVGHYIYGRVRIPHRALLVTQFRHPLPRTLSVHGWLRGGYLRRHGTLEGFPDLERWIAGTKGRRHTQMAQLAVGFGDGYRREVAHTATGTLLARALERLETDVAWFGIAELFEESIFTLAHVCGIEAVPAWERDVRNTWREPLAGVEPRVVDLIHDRFRDEITFYEHALALFRERLGAVRFGPALAEYQAACSDQYGERILVATPPVRRQEAQPAPPAQAPGVRRSLRDPVRRLRRRLAAARSGQTATGSSSPYSSR
jgi:hypothetical protein